jgi:hypothetical protein
MVATNKYPSNSYLGASSMSFPAEHAEAVTPSDSTDLLIVSRALFVGGAGNIAVVMASGAAVTFTGVLAGSILPIRVARVKSTSTTATNITSLS